MKITGSRLHDHDPPEAPEPSRGLWLAMWAVWLVGVGLTVVLVLQGQTIAERQATQATTSARVGCGPGQPCEEVLASPYSRVLGIPLTRWSAGYYALVATVLVVSSTTSRLARHPPPRSLTLPVVTFLGVSAGVWCMAVMLRELDALCVYCTALHGTNLLLFVLALVYARQDWRRVQRQRWNAALRPLPASVLVLHGVLAVLLAATQVVGLTLFHASPPSGSVVEPPSARLGVHAIFPSPLESLAIDAPGSASTTDDRTVATLWTIKGSRDAPNRMVVFLCPTCSTCGRLARLLDEIVDRHADQVRIDVRFVPLWHTCNDAVRPGSMDFRHREACGLVRTALAVAQARPDRFSDYLDWLFAANTDLDEATAIAEAQRRVDERAFDVARDSDPLWSRFRADARLAQEFGVETVPQLFIPSGQVVGGITVENLERLLSEEFGWDETAQYDATPNPQIWVASDRIEAHVRRARQLIRQGQFQEATEAYRSALELRPDWIDAALELAWLLATCKQAGVRNGSESLRIARAAASVFEQRATQEADHDSRNKTGARVYDALAAAYAEAGDFDQAQAYARRAMKLHDRNQHSSEAIRANERLESYQRHEPLRE